MNDTKYFDSKCVNVMTQGTRVRLKNMFDVNIWRVNTDLGVVVNIRKFGPIESMVTARFGDKRIHISDSRLEVYDAQE